MEVSGVLDRLGAGRDEFHSRIAQMTVSRSRGERAMLCRTSVHAMELLWGTDVADDSDCLLRRSLMEQKLPGLCDRTTMDPDYWVTVVFPAVVQTVNPSVWSKAEALSRMPSRVPRVSSDDHSRAITALEKSSAAVAELKALQAQEAAFDAFIASRTADHRSAPPERTWTELHLSDSD